MNFDLVIQGKNVHVFKYIDSTPFEIVCATDMIFEPAQELIGATTPDSGEYTEVIPRLRSAVLTLSGVMTSDNDGNVSYFYLLQNITEVQDLLIVFTDNAGDERTITGNFYIERMPVSAPADAASAYEIILRSSGAWTSSSLSDPAFTGSNVASDTFTVSGGVIQDASLIDVSIVGLWQEGTNMESAGISYTYSSGTGIITPDANVTIDGQKLFVIWLY